MGSNLSDIIRPATATDIPTLAKLSETTFVETFGYRYSTANLAAFIANSRSENCYRPLLQDPNVKLWLAMSADAEPLGYVVAGACKLPIVNREARAGEIRELYVRTVHQQRKLGSQLLNHAIDWLNSQKFQPLYIGVWSENIAAQRLYARFGFEKIGEYDFLVGQHIDREFILKRPLSTTTQ